MENSLMDPTTAVIYHLTEHLKKAIPEIGVIPDFPETNDELKMPCVSINVGSPEYVTAMPYEHNVGAPKDHIACVKMVVGYYDATLQLDLWCASKVERRHFREKLLQALNPKAMEGITGLGLKLTRYHDSWANLTMDSQINDLTEASSQRGEWRSTINVLANYSSIIVGEMPIVEQLDLELDVSESKEEFPPFDEDVIETELTTIFKP